MAVHVFDVTAFRAQFPAFASELLYPDLRLQGFWDMAVCYISDADNCDLSGAALQLALNLMTAHLAACFTIIDATPGGSPGVLAGASIDKVSITLQAPTTGPSGWRFWLATTPYGIQLWALLTIKSAGGWYVGGSFERQGFRKAGGLF